MGGNQGEPSRGEPPGAGQRSLARRMQDGVPQDADERVGPVALARHVKADGRALILYSVDRQPAR